MAQVALAHQFDDLDQQREANVLGMWVFIVTEVMMFGGLFTGYAIYRFMYPAAFAEGTHHLNIVLGTINTVVLLSSNLAVMLALHASQTDRRRTLMVWLLLTIILGSLFLGIKGVEYLEKFRDHLVPGRHFLPGETGIAATTPLQLFFSFYFVMTGLHALHLAVGIGILIVLLLMAWLSARTATIHETLRITSLYWHFVDVVWILLFTSLYLLGGRT